MIETARFHWVDHLLFALSLVLSACIGIYYGFIKKQGTTKDIFLGSREMHIFPVTLSILASFMSAVSVLGTPAEVYQFGTQYFMLCLSYFISFPVAAHIYLPIFHNLQLTSAHEVSYSMKEFEKDDFSNWTYCFYLTLNPTVGSLFTCHIIIGNADPCKYDVKGASDHQAQIKCPPQFPNNGTGFFSEIF